MSQPKNTNLLAQKMLQFTNTVRRNNNNYKRVNLIENVLLKSKYGNIVI